MKPSKPQTITALPGWALDLLITGVLIVVAVALERVTAGRLATTTVTVIVGLVYFSLLRLGAVFARIGRTFGCGFAFLITWLLPCALVAWLAASSRRQMMVRDSLPLFILLGAYLVIVMAVTFERTRIHDTAQLAQKRAETDES